MSHHRANLPNARQAVDEAAVKAMSLPRLMRTGLMRKMTRTPTPEPGTTWHTTSLGTRLES
jgi:hypothetical protein